MTNVDVDFLQYSVQNQTLTRSLLKCNMLTSTLEPGVNVFVKGNTFPFNPNSSKITQSLETVKPWKI